MSDIDSAPAEVEVPEGWTTYPAGEGHIGARKWFGTHWKEQVVPVGNDLVAVLQKIEDEFAGQNAKTAEEHEVDTLKARVAELEAQLAPPKVGTGAPGTVLSVPSDAETLDERIKIAEANAAEAQANPTDPLTGEPFEASEEAGESGATEEEGSASGADNS